MRPRFFIFASILSTCFLLNGTASPKERAEIRAIWVTRWDYDSPDDIRRIIDNVADSRFNMIFFQVRGNASVFYPSQYEPWADELGGSDPGWNPLEEAIRHAKKRGVQLHAWVNVFPGWRGVQPPENPAQLYNAHPDWFMLDEDKQPMPLNSHYVWINPALPEVQNHLENIVLELADTPGLDGIHFDYFRYPGPGFSYDRSSVNRFGRESGKAPADSSDLWDEFRRTQITNWLRNVNKKIKAKNPFFKISSAVIGAYGLGPRVFLQNAHQWLSEGIIDYIVPMTYTPDTRLLRRWLTKHGTHLDKERILPGLFVYPDPDLNLLREQIQSVRDRQYSGFSVFAYRTLFPGHHVSGAVNSTLRAAFAAESYIPQFLSSISTNVIREVRWFPENPIEGDSIRIVCKIEGNENNFKLRLFALWFNETSRSRTLRLNLKRLEARPEYWYAPEYIPPQRAGDNLVLRVFAYQRGQEKKTAFASGLHQITIDVSKSGYRYDGPFGPLLTMVTTGAVDAENRIWVWEPGKGIRIINPDGLEASFSPINTLTDKEGNIQKLNGIAGMSILADSSVGFMISRNDSTHLFAAKGNSPVLAARMKFPRPGRDMAAAADGSIFVLRNGGWYIVNRNGDLIGEYPFSESHTVNNIAVSPNGREVLIACRTEGTVHRWAGYTTLTKALYTALSDLDIQTMGIGSVSIGSTGLIFLAETSTGYLRILEADFGLVDVLCECRAPRLALPSFDNEFFYILETGGTTPVRMSRWNSNPY